MGMFEELERYFIDTRTELEDYLKILGLTQRQVLAVMKFVDILCDLSAQMEQEAE